MQKNMDLLTAAASAGSLELVDALLGQQRALMAQCQANIAGLNALRDRLVGSPPRPAPAPAAPSALPARQVGAVSLTANVQREAREFALRSGGSVMRKALLDHLEGLGLQVRTISLRASLWTMLKGSGEWERTVDGYRLARLPAPTRPLETPETAGAAPEAPADVRSGADGDGWEADRDVPRRRFREGSVMADVVVHAREFVGAAAGRAVTRREMLDHLAGAGVDGRKTGLAVRLKPILRESGEFEMDGAGIRLRGSPSPAEGGEARDD